MKYYLVLVLALLTSTCSFSQCVPAYFIDGLSRDSVSYYSASFMQNRITKETFFDVSIKLYSFHQNPYLELSWVAWLTPEEYFEIAHVFEGAENVGLDIRFTDSDSVWSIIREQPLVEHDQMLGKHRIMIQKVLAISWQQLQMLSQNRSESVLFVLGSKDFPVDIDNSGREAVRQSASCLFDHMSSEIDGIYQVISRQGEVKYNIELQKNNEVNIFMGTALIATGKYRYNPSKRNLSYEYALLSVPDTLVSESLRITKREARVIQFKNGAEFKRI